MDVPIKNELKVNKNFSKSIEKDTKAGIRQFRNELRQNFFHEQLALSMELLKNWC